MRVADLIAYAPCRFADDLYPVKHRVLQQFVGKTFTSPQPWLFELFLSRHV